MPNHTDFSEVEEFERIGYTYRKVMESEHYILWRATKTEPEWNPKWDRYEVWKKVYAKNPDGTVVMRKIGDSDFGSYGWFFANWGHFNKYIKRYPEECPEEVRQFARYAP